MWTERLRQRVWVKERSCGSKCKRVGDWERASERESRGGGGLDRVEGPLHGEKQANPTLLLAAAWVISSCSCHSSILTSAQPIQNLVESPPHILLEGRNSHFSVSCIEIPVFICFSFDFFWHNARDKQCSKLMELSRWTRLYLLRLFIFNSNLLTLSRLHGGCCQFVLIMMKKGVKFPRKI